MMPKIYKVGIAGFGVVGKTRFRVSAAHPLLKVVAVCDERLDGVDFLPEDKTVKAFTSDKELLKCDFDILFVCLPNYLATDTTIAGLEKGVHVFCEKPPGKDLNDIRRALECHQKRPTQKLKYGFNHRYHESVIKAMEVIGSGELGEVIDLRGVYGKSKIISFQSDWRTRRSDAGGGILLDQGIHMVDMMRLFAGDFTQVHSFISNRFWKHDVEDNAYAIMKTEEGVVAMLQSSATQWKHNFQLSITLTKGAIVMSGILSSTKSYAPETITILHQGSEGNGDPYEETLKYNVDHSWEKEVEDFVDSIVTNRPITNGSATEAYKTMKIVFDIYQADKEWASKFNIKG